MSDVDQSVSNPAQGLKKIKGVEGVGLVSGLYDVVATVRGRWVVIMGEVVGNVQASERVELKGAARVLGEMEAPVVVLEEGALFEGQCRIATTRPDEAARDSSVIPLKRWEMLSQ